MKISAGTACIAFTTEEIGRHFVAALGVKTPGPAFATIGAVVSTWSAENMANNHAILFRSEADIALFAQDRKKFPYSEFLVRVAEL